LRVSFCAFAEGLFSSHITVFGLKRQDWTYTDLFMNIRAVVFDMDGLILDTEPLYKNAWQLASTELGYEIDDTFYATLIGRPTSDCEELLLRQFGSGFPLGPFRLRWPELWQNEAAKGIPTKAGLPEILAFLEHNDLSFAVATSSDAKHTGISLRRAGLEGRFGIVVTGDEVMRGKPAPDIYIEAARRLRIEASQCIALEDSEAGIVAAHEAGMLTVLIPDLARPTDAAVEASSYILGSLYEARDLLCNIIIDGL